MKRVAILSLGLIGGSLGLALKRRPGDFEIHGFTRSVERGEKALARKAIDHFHADARDAVRHADIVVCCAPILSIPQQLISVIDALKPGVVVTDVGSTKSALQKECANILTGRDAYFVGGHPIAGSEQQGIEAARDNLYDQAMVVITPDETTRPQDVRAVRDLWEVAGGAVVEMTPEEHDRVLASTSHLPHVVASLLAATVGRPGQRADLARFCGTGYRDTTRIATGGTDIWLDILRTNRPVVAAEMKALAAKMSQMIEKLDASDFSGIEDLLEEGKKARETYNQYGHQSNSEE